jgi:predicted N-acetyltransferase YhbS
LVCAELLVAGRNAVTTRAECEQVVNYEETARLATEAFASSNRVILAERLRWFYERCFSLGATVIALRDGDRKVGQIAMVRQRLRLDGQEETAAQLVDLFISREFRGKERLRQLYAEVERQFIQQDIRFAIGMPNAKALGVNAYFFDLKPFLRLPFSMGVATPLAPQHDIQSSRFDPADKGLALSLLAGYGSAPDENGVIWDPARLFERLCNYGRQYGIHTLDGVLLISSPRISRGMMYTLLCGFMTRKDTEASRATTRRLVREACKMWKRPLFAYAGVNSRLAAAPGLVLPGKIRPSPLLVQLRDFKPERRPLRLDRFELIDFDYA